MIPRHRTATTLTQKKSKTNKKFKKRINAKKRGRTVKLYERRPPFLNQDITVPVTSWPLMRG